MICRLSSIEYQIVSLEELRNKELVHFYHGIRCNVVLQSTIFKTSFLDYTGIFSLFLRIVITAYKRIYFQNTYLHSFSKSTPSTYPRKTTCVATVKKIGIMIFASLKMDVLNTDIGFS
jgi:hypothetical protein